MTRKQHLRRVGILCCHCLRNLAFYNAGWRNGKPQFKDQFWVNANGNFLDICILEWCKLFSDTRGMHLWKKVVTDPRYFFGGLLRELKMTENDFNAYINELRAYRDKFVAHLDSEETMHIPMLTVARISASYLYDHLRVHEDEDDFFRDAPKKASMFYQHYLKEGRSGYQKTRGTAPISHP